MADGGWPSALGFLPLLIVRFRSKIQRLCNHNAAVHNRGFARSGWAFHQAWIHLFPDYL